MDPYITVFRIEKKPSKAKIETPHDDKCLESKDWVPFIFPFSQPQGGVSQATDRCTCALLCPTALGKGTALGHKGPLTYVHLSNL